MKKNSEQFEAQIWMFDNIVFGVVKLSTNIYTTHGFGTKWKWSTTFRFQTSAGECVAGKVSGKAGIQNLSFS